MNLEEILEEYLNLDDDTRIKKANECVARISTYLSENYGKTSAHHTICQMFAVFCCIDGVISYKEYELFLGYIKSNYTYENFCNDMKNGQSECMIGDLFCELEDEEDEFMSDVLMLLLCIVTTNKVVTTSEKDFINKYFID